MPTPIAIQSASAHISQVPFHYATLAGPSSINHESGTASCGTSEALNHQRKLHAEFYPGMFSIHTGVYLGIAFSGFALRHRGSPPQRIGSHACGAKRSTNLAPCDGTLTFCPSAIFTGIIFALALAGAAPPRTTTHGSLLLGSVSPHLPLSFCPLPAMVKAASETFL
ncbi:hypothetical protein CC80DRAFT_33894 [Byssothecium circinans]|uniref:Uncharacterized protein n=1 Tax=Byssothecium circinans TaxID=147558 RepID=A0A6A5U0H1_9PLEO|nr:hypothetical protein CC80DRAFT_33894 [Byssothecium circinans]